RSIKLITAKIADAIIEGKQGQVSVVSEEASEPARVVAPVPSLVGVSESNILADSGETNIETFEE
ncbi:MAG: hypothetical protein HY711_08615, partial [Candidatus Melainabacteria bacterium]|nr:hypothetical protein [Candidatus Melainabacteria bacterium]